MTQEPNKSNIVFIIVAIIGVCGTVIGATINVMGNINVEKIRQETELTRIALPSIATQMVLQSTASVPVTIGTTSPNSSNYQEKVVDVNAKLDWQTTDISVEVGDIIVISYVSGSWSQCAPSGCPYQKPEGVFVGGQSESESFNYADNEISGCRHAALIARTGTFTFCIGNGTTIQASEAGVLELRINDRIVYDNDGIVSMRVQVQK
jgi:hypothetical protein